MWSVKMKGPDAWVYEDKDKVWATDYTSIYCLNLKDGKVIWKITPDQSKRINLFWVWNGLICYNLEGTGITDFLHTKFYFMSVIDQKVLYSQDIFNRPGIEVDNGKLYFFSSETIQTKYQPETIEHVYRVDLKTFQKEWESVGPGDFRRYGDKIIHCSVDEIVWTEKWQSGRSVFA